MSKRNPELKNTANLFAKESIEEYVKNNHLNIEKLSEYLRGTQENKLYLTYKNGIFRTSRISMDNYRLVRCKKVTHNTYHISTQANSVVEVLLRWKNGNGIAFPAFQIKLKPTPLSSYFPNFPIRSQPTKLLRLVNKYLATAKISSTKLTDAIKSELGSRKRSSN